MKTCRVVREYTKIIKEYPGLEVERVSDNGHYKMYLSTPVGPKIFTAPRTPSDRRAELNNRSLFNNWSKGINK